MTERNHRYRLIIAAGCVILALTGLSARLAYLHLSPVQEDRRTQIQELRYLEKNLTVYRGKILDRDGKILALDVSKKELCADPALIVSNRQVQAVAERLGACLGLSPDTLAARLDDPVSRFAFLCGYGRPLDDDQAAAISRLNLPGVFFNEIMVRIYPRGASLCHVLGYVNLERQGSAGIEQRWDRYLCGVPGLLISERDGRRRELYDRRMLEIKPRPGADVVLTLNQYVQYVTERALAQAVQETGAAAAWAIVEQVRTGEILAMASYPAYDLNQYRSAQPEQMRNRCIGNIYEPGSTFKIAVVAAALNEKLVSPAQIFDCENGAWIYQRRPLRDYHPYGLLSVADVIKKSSNIGAAKIALLLGSDRLYRYLKAFGIGIPTGLELPGEEAGLLAPVSQWTSLSITRIAIGHEVAVTALQMLQVMCALANDGVLMKPYLVRQVIGPDGDCLFQQQPVVVGRPIRPETAAEMRRLLVRVTEEGGTGYKARIDGYMVGGKTGTSQKAIPGGYSDTLNMASFAGFVPAEDPQLAIIVVLDEPKTVHTGGAVAAPVFKEIAEQSVRYLDIPPVEGSAVARRSETEKTPGI